MSYWNPWRGCKKYSEGCLHCYIHKGDVKRGIDTSNIVKTKDFYKPIEKNRNGEYKLKSGLVYVCFSSDFFIEEADEWRLDAWKMIKERKDCTFLFLTKRIERFYQCIPQDWTKDSYSNVIICCTVENQRTADIRLNIYKNLPLNHKIVTAQPLIERIEIEKYIDGFDEVIVGGESDKNGRLMDYDWVLSIRNQCINKNVSFTFRQCSTNFIKDGILYKINPFKLFSQAKQANIDYKASII